MDRTRPLETRREPIHASEETEPSQAEGQRLSARAAELASGHRDELVERARSRLGSRADEAEELVQEFLCDLCAGLFDDRAVPEAKTVAFAKGVIENRARNLRRKKTEARLTEEPYPAQWTAPWEAALGIRRREALLHAFRALPARDRRVLVWCAIDGQSAKKVAVREGVSPDTVRQRLHRARRRLRRSLEPHDIMR